MRRCCVLFTTIGFKATYPVMDAVSIGDKGVAPPKRYSPATKALRKMWNTKGKDCSIDTLCSVCRSFAISPPHENIPVEIDIYNVFKQYLPQVVVASVIMGVMNQRVPVPEVTCTEVFKCLAILDKLGDEDRVIVERGMHELLYDRYDREDPSAAVLAFCVRPADRRRTAAPLIREFLERLVGSDELSKVDVPPPLLDDGDTAENAALKDYLKVFKRDEDAVCAVVSLIRGVPNRYKNRVDILFAMRLETLLRACAHDVWPDSTDTSTRTTAIDELLEKMRSEPESDADSVEPSPAATCEITFDSLKTRADWHSGFTKTLSSSGKGFILKSEEKNKDGTAKKQYKVFPTVNDEGEQYYVIEVDITTYKRIESFEHLAEMLRGTIPVPHLEPFDPSTVLLPGIEFNAGVESALLPEMLGTIIEKDVDPCFEQQLLKRHCTLVNGGSGTGKTVFSTMTLPRLMYSKPLVLHKVIKEEDERLAEIEELDREYQEGLQNNKLHEMRHFFASCALRRRRESTLYADAAEYARWMEVCSTILGKNVRNTRAMEYVVDVLQELLGNMEWVNETNNVVKCPDTVILVIDELGKCLSLARAIISAQYLIYMDKWVRSHFAKLELVLCGTGTEMAVIQSSRLIATDPTSVNVLTLLRPNPLFLDALFFWSLLGRGPKNDTVELTRSNAQRLYPMVYSQYTSSSLFNDAKTNTRLYVQSCYFFRIIFNSLMHSPDVHKELEKKHAARLDSCFVRTLGLDGCVRLAIHWFIRCNGLGRVRKEEDRMAVDAALTSALQHVRPLIPLPPLHKDNTLMKKAATLGLIVRQSGEIPSPAMTAVVTFGYTQPCTALEGYTQEQFTAEWASRLVEVQTGYAAPIVSLPFCLPWKGKKSPSADDITPLLQQLREHKALVLVNGPSAPGADVMIVQLRRPYSELSHRMAKETYDTLYPDGVAAIVTVISNKQRSKEILSQGVTLGVVNGEELLASVVGTVTSEMWRDACKTEQQVRGKIVELLSTSDTLFSGNEIAKSDAVASQMNTYSTYSTDYHNQLRYLSSISTVYEKKPPGKTNPAEESKNSPAFPQLSVLHGLKKNDYHHAGPLFLGLLCVRALVPTDKQMSDLLFEDPDKLREALVTELKDDAVISVMRSMDGLRTDESAVRVLVRPRFVCGDDPPQRAQSEGWKKSVLSGDVFSWACAEDTTDWVCAPGSFGPLEKMIRVEENRSKKGAK